MHARQHGNFSLLYPVAHNFAFACNDQNTILTYIAEIEIGNIIIFVARIMTVSESILAARLFLLHLLGSGESCKILITIQLEYYIVGETVLESCILCSIEMLLCCIVKGM